MQNAELERLAILAEECGEVIQIIGKIIRHGYESYNPFDENKTLNRRLLERELSDIELIRKLMIEKGDIDEKMLAKFENKKRKYKNKYLRYNKMTELGDVSKVNDADKQLIVIKKLYEALKALLQAIDDEGWHCEGEDWKEQADARKLLAETSSKYLY